MMKKLTIIVNEEDLIKIVGTCLKTGADFNVETLPEEEPRVPRTLNRVKGLSVYQIILDELKGVKNHTLGRDYLRDKIVEFGYAPTSLSPALTRLKQNGDIVIVGDSTGLISKEDH